LKDAKGVAEDLEADLAHILQEEDVLEDERPVVQRVAVRLVARGWRRG